jgi:hypothetical protein
MRRIPRGKSIAGRGNGKCKDADNQTELGIFNG